MPVQSCPITTFVDDAVCYGMHKLNPVEQKAFLIYAMVAQLQAIGGADYTTAFPGTLLTDSACMYKLNEELRKAAYINLAFKQAEAAGFPVTTLANKVSAIKCIRNESPERLDQIILYLTCLLGPHASQA
jgi:hypothetical protein